MTNTRRPILPAAVIREISVAASCDPRTVVRVAGGESARSYATDQRIRAALTERGLSPRPYATCLVAAS